MHDPNNPRLRLANATREVLQHSATSTAHSDQFAQAANLLEQAAALLAPGPHGRSYHASAEGAGWGSDARVYESQSGDGAAQWIGGFD